MSDEISAVEHAQSDDSGEVSQTIPAPRGTWIAAMVAIGLVLVQIVALTVYWLSQRPSATDVVDESEPITAVVGDPIKLSDVTAKVKVSVVEGIPAPSPGYQGIVTRNYVGNGQSVSSGQRIFELDGVTRYAYHSTKPFYRVLKQGDTGEDVVLLRQLLNDLGLGPVSIRRDTFDYMVAAAVTKLSMKIGMPAQAATTMNIGPTTTAIANNGSPVSTTTKAPPLATPTTTTTAAVAAEAQKPTTIGPVFNPEWTVWIPSPVMVADTSKIRVGLPLPATGEPMFSSARSLGDLVVTPSQPIGSSATPVDRTIEIPTIPVKLPFANGAAVVGGGDSAARLLGAVLSRQKPGEPLTDVEFDGVVRSVTSRNTVSVPVTAIYTDSRNRTCAVTTSAGVKGQYRRVPVVVVGSSTSSGVAAISGLTQGDVIVTNPGPAGLAKQTC